MNSLYLKYNSVQSVDTEKLDQLLNLGRDIEEDVLGQLLKIHHESAEIIIQEMNQFLTQKNFTELKRSAHKFKSSCANLGLLKLSNLCSDFESFLSKHFLENSAEIVSAQEFIDCIQYEFSQTNQKLFSYQKVA
jgi:HPt (histidine-containing phosphotransfer) domain-containing protein